MSVYKGDQVIANGIVVDEGTTDYTELENKPQINGVELSGNKSAIDLGLITSDDIPTAVSELTNDTGYITDSALTNYALKTEIPANTSDLNNDSGYITNSVNNLTNYPPTSTLSTNYVNTTSDQTINGTKTFSNTIIRTGGFSEDSTNIYAAKDNNDKGYVTTVAYYATSRIYHRLSATNNTAAKTGYFDVICDDEGNYWTQVGGSGTYKKADSTSVSSMQVITAGEVNDPSQALNVVHRSGDETVSGTKIFTGAFTKRANYSADVTSETIASNILNVFDTNNKLMTALYTQRTVNTKKVNLLMRTVNPNIAENAYGEINLQLEDSGKLYALYSKSSEGVTIDIPDTGAYIPTMDKVNSRITSIMNNSAYVPADTYQDVELTSSGQTIIAPGNGYLCYNGTSTTNAGCYMLNTVSGLGSQSIPWQQGGGIVLCNLSVKAGDPVKIVYGGTKTYLRFIPLVSVN